MDQIPLDVLGMTQSVKTTGTIGRILEVVFVGGYAVGAVRGAYFRMEVETELVSLLLLGGGRHGQQCY